MIFCAAMVAICLIAWDKTSDAALLMIVACIVNGCTH